MTNPTTMFYVIYSSAADLYVNDEGGLGNYDGAAQFGSIADAEWELDTTTTGLKIVGPYIEGEQP